MDMFLVSSKIVLPSPFLLNFYYYYSYTTLILCWFLTPFIFYIILTQSKYLKSFKWLIINHTFWCLALETVLGVVKPLFLLPAPGGIHIGPFQHIFDFRFTAFSALICFVFCANCVIGLTATIASRYLIAFPSKFSKWLTLKVLIYIMVLASLGCYVIIVLVFLPVLSLNVSTIKEWAIEIDPYLQNFFEEPSLFLLPPAFVKSYCFYIIAFSAALNFMLASILLFFIYTATKFKTVTAAKLKFSLILSSIAQVFITFFMLLLPVLAFFIFVGLEIANSASAMLIAFCLILSHCLIEYFATIYFILPYRNFVSKFIQEKIFRKKFKIEPIRVTAYESKGRRITSTF